MEAVKEGRRAPTAANESEWAVGEVRREVVCRRWANKGSEKLRGHRYKHLNAPSETRAFPSESLVKLDVNF